MTRKLFLTQTPSPLGQILIVFDPTAIYALDFEGYEERLLRLLQKHHGSVTLVKPDGLPQTGSLTSQDLQAQLQAYFSGALHSLDQLPVKTAGTAFQQQVWQGLRSIPPGQVLTYGDLARQLNHPKAVRAVGMANAHNPIAIVLPCHRVIGANGQLTGYAGGLARKQWLLEHEGVDLAASLRARKANRDENAS